ncbi:MAG: hypothetical protein PHU71_04375 [Candidatus Gracilibacteria bacterium]|nr:hypothetical protein [Candidatus Gracilibacteria bacterium]
MIMEIPKETSEDFRTATIIEVLRENNAGIQLQIEDHMSGIVTMGIPREDLEKYGLKGFLKPGTIIRFKIAKGVKPEDIELV